MRTFFISIFIFIGTCTFSQNVKDSINWISVETAGTNFLKQQKPILFYFYKQDCDSCRKQEETTFSNPEVANYINILFYPVKIDVNTKDSLKFFDGRYYKNSGKYGTTHDLAYKLAGNDTFPALVVFSRRATGRAFKGYKDRDEIFRILIYYAEDVDVATPFEGWYKYHKKGYPAGESQIITHLKIKWQALNEVKELNKTLPRKMLLNFYNYNKISCTLMRTQTYNNPKIAKYLNEKFYPVNIDVFTQDTLEMMGIKYINENRQYKFHQLPIAALEGKMNFPAFIILDEKGKVLAKYQEYMTPEKMEKIMKYYGSDAYKKEEFNKYIETFKTSF